MAPRTYRPSLLKLRLAMIGTWAAITGLASLLLVALVTALGWGLNIFGILFMVVLFHVIQWLLGPYMINAIYRVRPLRRDEEPWLHRAIDELSRISGIRRPKLMVAEVEIPNAFAYGSPLTGNMVAVTRGLLNSLKRDEVEAVIGHELGHLKHRDVLVMMSISIIPALLYYLGYMLYLSGLFGGGSHRQGGVASAAAIGVGLMALSFIFNLFVYYMSRLREYYADSHAALTVKDGARKLQRALARIMVASGRIPRAYASNTTAFKMFLISDPETRVRWYGSIDELVEEIKKERPSLFEELFSTHPHPAKRLRYLDKFIT